MRELLLLFIFFAPAGFLRGLCPYPGVSSRTPAGAVRENPFPVYGATLSRRYGNPGEAASDVVAEDIVNFFPSIVSWKRRPLNIYIRWFFAFADPLSFATPLRGRVVSSRGSFYIQAGRRSVKLNTITGTGPDSDKMRGYLGRGVTAYGVETEEGFIMARIVLEKR